MLSIKQVVTGLNTIIFEMHLIIWLLQTKSRTPLEEQVKCSLLPLRLARFCSVALGFYFQSVHVQPYNRIWCKDIYNK
jgi:hypothetical protein